MLHSSTAFLLQRTFPHFRGHLPITQPHFLVLDLTPIFLPSVPWQPLKWPLLHKLEKCRPHLTICTIERSSPLISSNLPTFRMGRFQGILWLVLVKSSLIASLYAPMTKIENIPPQGGHPHNKTSYTLRRIRESLFKMFPPTKVHVNHLKLITRSWQNLTQLQILPDYNTGNSCCRILLHSNLSSTVLSVEL